MVLKLTETFIKECNEKENKYFVSYDHYRANYDNPIVTGKFYSKYDKLDLSAANPDLVEAIKIAKVKIPKDKYPWPVTTNHMYGWFDRFYYIDRNDRRFYCPMKTAPFVTHEINLKRDITMHRPPFTGVPFKLG